MPLFLGIRFALMDFNILFLALFVVPELENVESVLSIVPLFLGIGLISLRLFPMLFVVSALLDHDLLSPLENVSTPSWLVEFGLSYVLRSTDPLLHTYFLFDSIWCTFLCVCFPTYKLCLLLRFSSMFSSFLLCLVQAKCPSLRALSVAEALMTDHRSL